VATTTPKLGLTKPAGTEKALVSVLNTNADLIDAWATTVDNQIDGVNVTDWNAVGTPGFYACTNTATNAPFGFWWQGIVTSNGAEIIQRLRAVTHGIGEWIRIRDGSSVWGPWKRTDGVQMPSAVPGGTFDVNTGNIFPTVGATSLDTNDAFSTYNRMYRIDFMISLTTSGYLYFRYRSAGSTISVNNYNVSSIESSGGSTVSFSNQVATALPLNNQPQTLIWGNIVLFDPAHAAGGQVKLAQASVATGAPSQVTRASYLNGSDLTVYDGFQIYSSAGAFQGPSHVRVTAIG
jgi:hypothetical protein